MILKILLVDRVDAAPHRGWIGPWAGFGKRDRVLHLFQAPSIDRVEPLRRCAGVREPAAIDHHWIARLPCREQVAWHVLGTVMDRMTEHPERVRFDQARALTGARPLHRCA